MEVNIIEGDRRPNLFDIWKYHHFDIEVLCVKYYLKRPTVLHLLRNEPVIRNEAEEVLHALSHFLHQNYSLETVKVPLISQEEERHAESE